MKVQLTLMLLAALSGAAHADSLWDHNGSVVRLVSDGTHRTLLYEAPRESLQRAGVTRGTVLFDGERDGRKYRGVAQRFAKNCRKPLFYSVTGIVETETRIVLHGKREIYDSSCRPTGEIRNDTLLFTYLRDASGGAQMDSLPEKFSGTWTSKPGNCTTDFEVPDSPQVMTIGRQITTWKIYPPQSADEDAYDWCDVGNVRRTGENEAAMDLDCAHPGHSRTDIVIHMSSTERLSMDGTAFFRCK